MEPSAGKDHKILFLYNHSSTFIRNDLEIFKGKAAVVAYECRISKSLPGFIVSMAREMFFILFNISKSGMIYCWFADYHAFFPAFFAKLARKPFYLVLGGYDVNYLPELGYGSFGSRFRGYCTRYALRNATCNLPVSENLAVEARKRAGNINLHTLPTGYDPEKFTFTDELKENMVITAAIVHEKQTYLVKGLDRFLELARITPGLTFVAVGIGTEMHPDFEPVPENLKLIPRVDQYELYRWFGRARFYAQLSRSEGMPNGLCEAMLMKCIPLGMKVGGIPAVIAGDGYLLDEWDPLMARDFLMSHLADNETGEKARKSIAERFHYRKRAEYLESLLTRLKGYRQ
ncbi:MAG TPA: glycosyltransferase [Bacteroidales bacterium]|nr:glycosyltransferase [Bacteroidales bacterium]